MKNIVNKTRYILEEAFSILYTSKAINLLTIFIVGFTFFVLFSFDLAVLNLEEIINKLEKEAKIEVFLKKSLGVKSDFIVSEVKKFDFVKDAIYVSKNEGYRKFVEEFPELKEILEEMGENPFPPKITVFLKDRVNENSYKRLKNYFENKGIVEYIKDNRELISKIHTFLYATTIIGYFFGGILIFASLFTVVNILKILIYSKREEIGILDLIGASPLYIEIPFMLAIAIIVILGSLLSVVILNLMIMLFPHYAGHFYNFISPFFKIKTIPLKVFLTYTLFGVFISLFSSYFSIKNFTFRGKNI